mgnify:CR=1 FL=1
MNKLFRYAAVAVLVASFGMVSDYTADAAKSFRISKGGYYCKT